MRTTALLFFLSLWTEMADVCLGEAETQTTARGRDTNDGSTASAGGELIEVAAISTGSELTATCTSCEPEAPPISSHFMPECAGHFYRTSGSVVSCGVVSSFLPAAPDNLELFDGHFISRCAAT
eukprot:SAG11_NODE_3589_length_2350_cov_14.763169_2_plen_124_part_00